MYGPRSPNVRLNLKVKIKIKVKIRVEVEVRTWVWVWARVEVRCGRKLARDLGGGLVGRWGGVMGNGLAPGERAGLDGGGTVDRK